MFQDDTIKYITLKIRKNVFLNFFVRLVLFQTRHSKRWTFVIKWPCIKVEKIEILFCSNLHIEVFLFSTEFFHVISEAILTYLPSILYSIYIHTYNHNNFCVPLCLLAICGKMPKLKKNIKRKLSYSRIKKPIKIIVTCHVKRVSYRP